MALSPESELTRPAVSRWALHFLYGQSRSSGELKSQWRWIGKGDLAVDGNSLILDGRRHRYFRSAAKQRVQVSIDQVRNVVATGRLVRFDVKLDDQGGQHVEVVRLRTETAEAAQAIASSLSTTRSEEFERAYNEKLAFDRSMEELGTQSTVTAVLIVLNVAWYLIVASQGGGWLVPNPGVIIHWGSNFGPLTLNGEWWRLFTGMFVHFGIVHIVFNMWVLWNVGRLSERMFGSLHFALLYVFAGLCASLASLWWHPDVNSAGASGAIFGVVGGLLAFVMNPATAVPSTIVANQRRYLIILSPTACSPGSLTEGSTMPPISADCSAAF